MTAFKFRNLRFSEDGESVRVLFMDYFFFNIPVADLKGIGTHALKGNSIEFPDVKNQTAAERKFYFLLEKGFSSMKSLLTKKPALYIHENSGIPLVGCVDFGIVDRGTNFLELKPTTTCNIDCIYCSVDHTQRLRDIVVEEEYLIAELKKVMRVKKKRVNIHIGGQGEPTMYGDVIKLVRDLRKMDAIGTISINTNAVLLTEKLVDELFSAGLTHFHVSLNAFTQDKADYIANRPYPLDRVKKICEYISKRAKLILVPVWIPSVNDSEMDAIIDFAKGIRAKVGLQNFMMHSLGKKPVNPLPMKVFMQRLSVLEKRHSIDLKGLDGELAIEDDIALGKPFRKGQTVLAEIKADGRIKRSKIAISGDRSMTIYDCTKTGRIRARIISDKDNIFTASPA
jgi:uncharacterized protein